MPIRNTHMTLTEAAARLGVNRITIRRWIKVGKLAAEEIGGVVLIERKEIERVEAAQYTRNRALAEAAQTDKEETTP